MKYFITATIALMAYTATMFGNSDQLNIVNVLNVEEQMLNDIMLGQRPDVALEFSAQTVIPINFLLKGNLVRLSDDHRQLEVSQTFYVRNENDTFLFSTNLTEWKSLFEFITGQASIIIIKQEDASSIVVASEIFERT